MNKNPTENQIEQIWTLVREDKALPAESSLAEKQIYNQFSSIHQTMMLKWSSAPDSAVEAAKAIMPPSAKQIIFARLLKPNHAMGMARGLVAQVQFEADEVKVRAQVEQLPQGWRIWGRTNVSGWTIWSGHSRQACNERGEFDLVVETESLVPLSLQNESTIILLPVNDQESEDGVR